MSDRIPKLGDILITKDKVTKKQHIGMVCNITLINGFRSVFVYWNNNGKPRNYNERHGYLSTNIHNLRSEFTIMRKGELVNG